MAFPKKTSTFHPFSLISAMFYKSSHVWAPSMFACRTFFIHWALEYQVPARLLCFAPPAAVIMSSKSAPSTSPLVPCPFSSGYISMDLPAQSCSVCRVMYLGMWINVYECIFRMAYNPRASFPCLPLSHYVHPVCLKPCTHRMWYSNSHPLKRIRGTNR